MDNGGRRHSEIPHAGRMDTLVTVCCAGGYDRSWEGMASENSEVGITWVLGSRGHQGEIPRSHAQGGDVVPLEVEDAFERSGEAVTQEATRTLQGMYKDWRTG